MYLRIILLGFLFMTMTFSGCRYSVTPATPVIVADGVDMAVASGQDAPSPREIYLASDSSDDVYEGLNKQASVIQFYRDANYRLAWTTDRGRTSTGDSMLSTIRQVRYYGLLPGNYHLNELNEVSSQSTTASLLRQDVLLTDAFLSIAKDLKSGRLRRSDPTADSLQRLLLKEVLGNGDLTKGLESLEPQSPDYQSLKRGLRLLLDSAATADLARLLMGTADSTERYKRIQLLEINMERWRWEERHWGDRYIFINIPAFVARVVARDSVVLESKVIVGKPVNPTPELSSTIECFITYPYWHVPKKIAVEELLPQIQRDVKYLARNNFDVLGKGGQILNPDSVAWKSLGKNNFPITLRQREGPENSLGVLKFVFDNPYAVFLHDTNAKRLFQSSSRAFSHGCIRMERALELAHYLVTGDITKASPELTKRLRQAAKHTMDVGEPLPIHVRYFTAGLKGSELSFYKDLYKKDQALIRTLYPDSANYY